MTKTERVTAALRKNEVDRVPFSVYQHSTVHQRTVEKFVAYTLDFQERFRPDYIKVMFDDHYDLPSPYDFVRSATVWRELEEYDPHLGAFGRVLESLKRIKAAVGPDVPVIQTIYLPFHFGIRLAYRRILEDLAADTEGVRAGLTVIAGNTVRFGRACLAEAGIDGFFFGAYGCEPAWMSETQYRDAVLPLDRLVVDGLVGEPAPAGTPLTILHIHGVRDIFFTLLKDYPVDALSWEDRAAGPSLAEARGLTDKCLVGGVDFQKARHCPPEEVEAEGRTAIAAVGKKGFVLAPGCTFLPDTPEENMRALEKAAASRRDGKK
jgi:uroporphyrinogen decarboxylase